MNYFKILEKKIQDKSLKVGVIGLGYVGLPLLIQCIKKNFFVYGFDNDQKKIDMLQNGKSYIKHINQSEIKKIKSNKIRFTNNFSKIKEHDSIVIRVIGIRYELNDKYISIIAEFIDKFVPPKKRIKIESK